MDTAEFDAVLGAIYEAALAPERWGDVLAALTRLAGGVGSTLVAWNTAEDRSILVEAAGEFHDNEVGQRLYAEHYGALDLTRRLALTHPVGSTVLCHEHIGEPEVRASEYYNDFLMPQGGRFTIGVPLVRTAAVMASCGTHRGRHQGPFGDSERGLFERLAPHLRRALRIQEVLALAKTRERAALAALDRLPCAAFVLDRRGRVLAENAAARVLIAARQGLRLRQGVLVCDRADDQCRLDAALAAAGGGGPRGRRKPSRSRGRRAAIRCWRWSSRCRATTGVRGSRARRRWCWSATPTPHRPRRRGNCCGGCAD